MKPKPSKPAPKPDIARDLSAMFPEAAVARALGTASQAPVEDAARSSAFDQSGVELADVGARLRWVRQDHCDDNPFQTRTDYDDGHIGDITESFDRVGQLQPGIARPHPDKEKRAEGWVQIAAAHSRLRAVRAGGNAGANLPDPERFVGYILLLVRPLNDIEMAVIAIEENEARENPRVIDRIEGYLRFKTLLDEAGQGTRWAEFAESKGFTYRRLRQLAQLLELPAPVQKAINEGTWNEKHGRALLSLQDHPQQQKTLLRQISDESLSGSGAIKRAGDLRAAFPSQGDLDLQESSRQASEEHLRREAEKAREDNHAAVESGRPPLQLVGRESEKRDGGGGSSGGGGGGGNSETETDGQALAKATAQLQGPDATNHLEEAARSLRLAREALERVKFEGQIRGGERYNLDMALRDARALLEDLRDLDADFKRIEAVFPR